MKGWSRNLLFFFLRCIYLYLKGDLHREKRDKVRSSIHWLRSQMAETTQADSVWSQEPRASPRFSIWVQGPRTWVSFCWFPSHISRKVQRKWTARTWTSTRKGCWHCGQRLNLNFNPLLYVFHKLSTFNIIDGNINSMAMWKNRTEVPHKTKYGTTTRLSNPITV